MAARELGDLEGWEKAKKAAEDAFVMERLGEAAGGDWRQRATGWASLFDMITHQLVRQLLPGSPASWPRPDADEDQQNQRLLGALWPEVRGVLRKPDGMEAVRKRILGDADTIGDRLQWLGGSIATLPKVRSAFGKVIADEPELFDHLDRARRERNAIVHPRERADAVLVAGFRARVLQVCRALIRVRAS